MKSEKIKKILSGVLSSALCLNLAISGNYAVIADENTILSDDKIPSSEISENDLLPRAELPGIYPDEEGNETEYEENYSEYSSELFKDQPEIAATEETTESETGTVSGSCGDDVSFTLDLSTGKLIISGTGDMDFRTVYTSDVPFYEYKDKITEIEIKSGVTSIENYSFTRCGQLKSIIIPDTVTSIGEHAFNECESLTEIEIPDSVTEIGNEAFNECSKLESVTLSSGISEIPYGTFWNCEALKSITIPDSVEKIGNYAFYCCNSMSSVTFSKNLKSIGKNAFADCASLKSVMLYDGLLNIGESAFAHCTSLSEVNVPDSVETIGNNAFYDTKFADSMTDDFVVLGNGILYSYHGSSETVTIPENVRIISDSVFENNETIKSVVLPENLKSIGESAFKGCTSLSDINIVDSIEYVGFMAFAQTPFLKTQKDDAVIFGKCFYYYQGDEESFEIPEGITSISKYAFEFHFNLKNVTLPSTLKKIGYGAFVGCSGIEKIIIPESVTDIGDYSIGYHCQNGTSGTFISNSITICGNNNSSSNKYASENNFKFIALDSDELSGQCGDNVSWNFDVSSGKLVISGNGAMSETKDCSFKDYENLVKTVIIEDGVTSVSKDAFYGFGNLESVSIAESVETIDTYAFGNCASLKNITLPESVKSIGNYAFRYCDSLEEINIPASVTEIGEGILYDDYKLENINVDKNNQNFASLNGILYNSDFTELIQVPANSSVTCLELPETLKFVDAAAMHNNLNVKCIVFPETLTSIGYKAFYDNKSIEKLIFRGDAPLMNSVYNVKNNITVYYSGSSSGWTDFLSDNFGESDKLTAVDTDKMQSTQLTINADKTELSAGETLQLSADISPTLAHDFTWESSDSSVVRVFADGKIMAVNPGTATVTVTDADNKYSAECDFTVTGDTFSKPESGTQLIDDGIINYSDVYTATKQIPCEELNGIYFFSSSKLSFYSFVTKQFEEVYNFAECKDAYYNNGKLYVVCKNIFYVYDLVSRSVDNIVSLGNYLASAVGADDNGRIYIAASNLQNSDIQNILLFNSNGEQLSCASFPSSIYSFTGFDSSNGNFYIETYYDFYSWGYSHPGRALTMGKVVGDKITNVETYSSFLESGIISRSLDCIDYLCQAYYLDHRESSQLIGGRYLVSVSAMSSLVKIIDSKNDDLNTIMSFNRKAEEYEFDDDSSDTSSIGTRTVYNESNDSIIIYENGKTLAEYDMSGNKLAQAPTEHYVFNLIKSGDTIIAIEKDGSSYYIETFDWSSPESISISAQTDTMKVGQTQQLTVENGMGYTASYKWESSNPDILSVTASGRISAWKAGTAKIICSTSDGKLTAEYMIKVTDSISGTDIKNQKQLKGQAIDNKSANNYTRYANVVDSYLVENDDKTFTRIQNIDDSKILVENYNNQYALTDSSEISGELKIFGGFYSGSEYNYFVFGQSNTTESDNCEIMRIVKYSKDWERISSCSVKGANTYIPFDAGSLRMTENNGKLYVYTCHEMYQSSDGYHHQANMTYVMDEENMEITDSYYDVMNITYGYVSHSFNQFIQTDGKSIYRVDHGDANPRAISLTKCDAGGKITDVQYVLPYSIEGAYGANDTGVSVGGFELSSENCIITGNSVDMTDSENYSAFGQRNIFVTITDKNLKNKNQIWLTEYDKSQNITPRTPHLVKLNDEQFLVMWEEYNTKTTETSVRFVTINADGNVISKAGSAKFALSDCKPITCADNLVRWYVSDSDKVTMYTLNPFDLESVDEEIPDVTTTVVTTVSSTTKTTVKTTVKTTSKSSTSKTAPTTVSSSVNTSKSTETVTGDTDTISLSRTQLDMSAGDKMLLKVNNYSGSVIWVSGDKSVATVDEKGYVYAVSEGSTTIFAICGNTSLICKVTVSADIDENEVPGDANDDGILNVRDAAYIARMLALGSADKLPKKSDFNGDGKINVRDAAAIAKYIASRLQV